MLSKRRGRPKGHVGAAVMLDLSQIKQVLKVARSSGQFADRAEVAFRLTVEAGFRVSELCELKWSDFIDENGLIRERLDERFGARQSLSLSRPKIRQLVATYRERLEDRFGPVQRLPFFPSSRGEGFTAPSMTRFLNNLYRQAGVPGATSRSGRRTFKTGIR